MATAQQSTLKSGHACISSDMCRHVNLSDVALPDALHAVAGSASAAHVPGLKDVTNVPSRCAFGCLPDLCMSWPSVQSSIRVRSTTCWTSQSLETRTGNSYNCWWAAHFLLAGTAHAETACQRWRRPCKLPSKYKSGDNFLTERSQEQGVRQLRQLVACITCQLSAHHVHAACISVETV